MFKHVNSTGIGMAVVIGLAAASFAMLVKEINDAVERQSRSR